MPELTPYGLGISHKDGQVIVHLIDGTTMQKVGVVLYTPEQAVEVASLIIKHAGEA